MSDAELDRLFDDLFGRTRSSWNDRLSHWEKPASETEEAQITRAAAMVQSALDRNDWLREQGVKVTAQGSYYNNTNVRQQSDMDLCVRHRLSYLLCQNGLSRSHAQSALSMSDAGGTVNELATRLRAEIRSALTDSFGARGVDSSGSKAFRVHGVQGSRADVDVVPALGFVFAFQDFPGFVARFRHHRGIAIYSTQGLWTFNFPDRHYDNGVAKRRRTQHRFKKTVRMLKRLRDELAEASLINSKHVTSFLVESLTYRVEDGYFLNDDRYQRLLAVLTRMKELLVDVEWAKSAHEINDAKLLFGDHQVWSKEDALSFVLFALIRLEQ